MAEAINAATYLNPDDYPEDQRQLVEDFNCKLANSTGIITGLAKDYHTIWLVNCKDRSMELYRTTGRNTVSGIVELGLLHNKYDDFITAYVDTYVADRPDSVMRDVAFDIVTDRIANGEKYTVDYMRFNDDGNITYHQMTFALAGDPDDAEKFILAYRDVNREIMKHMADKKYLREQLNIVNALSRDYYNIFKINPETGKVVILKLDGYVTKGMEKPSEKEYPYDVLYKQYVKDRVYEEDIPSMMEALNLETIKEKLKDEDEYVSGYRVMDNGEVHYYQFTYIPINPLNKSAGILAGFKNVDDVIRGAREREQLIALAETDSMTGILNRGSGEHKVVSALAGGKKGMLAILDIDLFKNINDTYGHTVGDKVIRGIADILKEEFRESDVIFRLGGDEYAIFAHDVMNKNKGEAMIQRVFDRIATIDIPELEGDPFAVSAGAVIMDKNETASFADIYRKADKCVYISKETKGNSVTFYEDE